MKNSLRKDQLDAVEKLSKYKVGALFMEPGSGKTRSAVALIKSRKDIKGVLWFCPFQTKKNLEEELIKCGMDLETVEIVGIESLSNSDVLYLGLLNRYGERNDYFCVCDESLKIKNDSKRTKRIIHISKKAKYKLVLNGTPISKNYVDLYNQMEFLSPKILKMDALKFYKTFVIEKRIRRKGKRTEKQIIGYENLEYLFNLISPFIFESKLYLDICVFEYDIDYTVLDASRYNEFKKDFFKAIAEGDNLLGYLQQLQHSYSCDEGKLFTLRELLGDLKDEKVLIFCKYIDEQETVKKMVTSANHKVLSLQKHAFGLNLQEFNHIIFFNHSWDYALMDQARRRILRVGQNKDCHIYNFKSNLGLDNMIRGCLTKKSNLLFELKNKLIEELEL